MTRIMKNPVAAAALAGAMLMGLSACGAETTANRGLESIHQPVVSYTSYTYDVMGGSSGDLSHTEAQRLEGWLSSIGLGYGDHVVIASDAGYYSASLREGVANVVARHGLLIEDDDTFQAGQAANGGLRLTVRRAVASVPGCPDWSQTAETNMGGGASSNFGCGVNGNLAAMIANPEDLVRGQTSNSDLATQTSTKAIQTLQQKTPTGAGDLKNIQDYRGPAVAKIDAAFAELLRQDFPNKDRLISEFNAAREKASAYRAKSDNEIKVRKADRDPDVVKNTYAVMSAYVESAQKLWTGVMNNTSGLDPELSRLAKILVLAWNMRDTAGRERATIAGAISAKAPISPENLTNIASIRAQVGLMWRLLQSNISHREHDVVLKGVQSAKDGYFAKFQPLADQMRKLSSEGANYGMSTGQWADATTPLLATLLDVMEGASTASEAYTAQLKRNGWTMVMVSRSEEHTSELQSH